MTVSQNANLFDTLSIKAWCLYFAALLPRVFHSFFPYCIEWQELLLRQPILTKHIILAAGAKPCKERNDIAMSFLKGIADIVSIPALIPPLLMVLALSVDAFAASVAYGAEKIHIPTRSAVVISAICTGLLLISLAAGQWISPILPPQVARISGAMLLILIGLIKLFDAAFKRLLKKLQERERNLKFSFFSLHFILKVYTDCKAADRDLSRCLSVGEAAALAAALSIDGLATGFGAGLAEISLPLTLIMSFLLTLLAVKFGGWLGKKTSKLPVDLSFAGGGMLMLLGAAKLFL